MGSEQRPIEVEGPDGRLHRFAPGTPSDQIDREMRARYAPAPPAQPAQGGGSSMLDAYLPSVFNYKTITEDRPLLPIGSQVRNLRKELPEATDPRGVVPIGWVQGGADFVENLSKPSSIGTVAGLSALLSGGGPLAILAQLGIGGKMGWEAIKNWKRADEENLPPVDRIGRKTESVLDVAGAVAPFLALRNKGRTSSAAPPPVTEGPVAGAPTPLPQGNLPMAPARVPPPAMPPQAPAPTPRGVQNARAGAEATQMPQSAMDVANELLGTVPETAPAPKAVTPPPVEAPAWPTTEMLASQPPDTVWDPALRTFVTKAWARMNKPAAPAPPPPGWPDKAPVGPPTAEKPLLQPDLPIDPRKPLTNPVLPALPETPGSAGKLPPPWPDDMLPQRGPRTAERPFMQADAPLGPPTGGPDPVLPEMPFVPDTPVGPPTPARGRGKKTQQPTMAKGWKARRATSDPQADLIEAIRWLGGIKESSIYRKVGRGKRRELIGEWERTDPKTRSRIVSKSSSARAPDELLAELEDMGFFFDGDVNKFIAEVERGFDKIKKSSREVVQTEEDWADWQTNENRRVLLEISKQFDVRQKEVGPEAAAEELLERAAIQDESNAGSGKSMTEVVNEFLAEEKKWNQPAEGANAEGIQRVPARPDQKEILRERGFSERFVEDLSSFSADELIKSGKSMKGQEGFAKLDPDKDNPLWRMFLETDELVRKNREARKTEVQDTVLKAPEGSVSKRKLLGLDKEKKADEKDSLFKDSKLFALIASLLAGTKGEEKRR